MPAMLDDPTSPVIYRASGDGPYPTSDDPQIPSSIFPRPVTLRDRVTIATLVPFFSPTQVPARLLAYLCENLNKEIEGGDTYPMINTLPLETFGPYWFGNFGAVMILGDIGGPDAVNELEDAGADWNKICLGSFYVKPNYPGRSSHVCNGGFLVTPAARNKGVGKSMGECYLDWAPQLGYTYSVFNLVYESNTASCRIWDSLGFKRIGRVPGCGNLRSFGEPVDAIIYGRDLKSDNDNEVAEERFDKIRYYLRHSLYPQGADRSEKSRLRSAATHYKLIGGTDGIPEKLMLKDKEVISDPQSQYEIAKDIHSQTHGGINKTTASIATQYHWVRIKETVSHVIKDCLECKDSNKAPLVRSDSLRNFRGRARDDLGLLPISAQRSPDSELVAMTLDQSHLNGFDATTQLMQPTHDDAIRGAEADLAAYDNMAIDPHIMEQLQAQLESEYQDPFTHASLAEYSNVPHLAHHDHATDGFDDPQAEHFMTDTNVDLMDHTSILDTSPRSGHSRQNHQNMMRGHYMDTGGGSGYRQ